MEMFLMDEQFDAAPTTWNFPQFSLEIQKNNPNYASNQLQSGVFGHNLANSVEQSDPLESALNSIVSSPAPSNAGHTVNSGGDKLIIRELFGKLGSICESGDILTPAYIHGKNESTNPSHNSTPLNSPLKLNLLKENPDNKGISSFFESNFPVHPSLKPFSSDLDFPERAARFSYFATKNGGLGQQISMISDSESQLGDQERRKRPIQFRTSIPNKKPRKVSSSHTNTRENAEIGDSREGSSLSEQISYCEIAMKEKAELDPNNNKRKLSSKVKLEEKPLAPSAKIARIEGKIDKSNPDEASAMKNDVARTKTETNEGTQSGEDENQKNTKLPEPQKDYIHVRARRGQATDSHSLAERVRREKISERMKFLQDLVPGCNKVIGKAVMLDEIINYVQSLQRQVEFLSMKMASVNPRMNLTMEALLSKDITQSCVSLQHIINPLASSSTAFQPGCESIPSDNEIQFPVNSLNSLLFRNQQMQMIHLDGYIKDDPQVLSSWEDDLQSVVQMGFGENQQSNLHC